jgi:hypothetical protein
VTTPLLAPGVLLAPAVLPTGIDIPNPFEDIPNPFSVLAVTATDAAGSVATSLWTAAMLAIWKPGCSSSG